MNLRVEYTGFGDTEKEDGEREILRQRQQRDRDRQRQTDKEKAIYIIQRQGKRYKKTVKMGERNRKASRGKENVLASSWYTTPSHPKVSYQVSKQVSNPQLKPISLSTTHLLGRASGKNEVELTGGEGRNPKGVTLHDTSCWESFREK